ncbi:hypothetical protein M408DRAFT_321139 [Serendipita vermifera MAFF 305830]|uniref:Carbohydrate-binding module family 13 protein n=1 Tax=Serendipita vermifera MAFF 305830 TaxID=933852 RepID=A0A0C2X1B9_SERVB|nr:hypothetical protein M408DRAFT_321139 [Serendipita vermifera MAFF 305830]
MFVKTVLTAALLQTTSLVLAQDFVPLASQSFTYTNLPYQADANDGERGRQSGYNICNSTTENQHSLCQTAIINSVDDFCLWGAPEPNSLIGDTEGEAVAWCTKPGHGTRVMPAGTITGLTFVKTPDYIQVTGLINQANINIAADDSGGEMDPHGADQRGNPLGGLLFTNAWGGGMVQAVEWHNFMGEGAFCLKACDPSRPNAAHYCEHIFDRIGCWYNAPASYAEGVFESCQGESQDFPGIYTGTDGVVSTYTQPPEHLGPITTMPYLPKLPATSQCSQYSSSELFAGAPAAPTPVAGNSHGSTRAAAANSSQRTATGNAAALNRPSSSSSASPTGSPNAGMMGASVGNAGFVVGAFGVLAAALF